MDSKSCELTRIERGAGLVGTSLPDFIIGVFWRFFRACNALRNVLVS